MGSRRSGALAQNGNTMPQGTSAIFCGAGFDKSNHPYLRIARNNAIEIVLLCAKTYTLAFDDSIRYCIGWRDIETGQQYPCPTNEKIDKKFETCHICNTKTGFNPAFYHAQTISPQQKKRNSEPHILYLAHFAPGIFKVGISHAARNISRLLEQGARSAIILRTCENADQARNLEASIATRHGINETLSARQKIKYFSQAYDQEEAKKELLDTKEYIENELFEKFSSDVLLLDHYYFLQKPTEKIHTAIDITDQKIISGTLTAQVGGLSVFSYEDDILLLSLKKFVGAKILLTKKITPLALAPRQISLF